MRSRYDIYNTHFVSPKFIKTNFSGDPDRDINRNSDRTARIIIPDDLAHEMIADGFNISESKPFEFEDGSIREGYFYTKVKINYDYFRPPVIKLSSGDKPVVTLSEESVGCIDQINDGNGVDYIHVALTPSTYNFRGQEGLSLYVQTMYVVQKLVDDPFYSMFPQPEEE